VKTSNHEALHFESYFQCPVTSNYSLKHTSCLSFNIKVQVSHPDITTRKIIVVIIGYYREVRTHTEL
jgi:hypothetical protein